MSSNANDVLLTAASFNWAAVGVLCIVIISHLVFWVFRWMARKCADGMDVRADDLFALAAQVCFIAYVGVVIGCGLVGHVEIPQSSEVASQFAIVCSQLSQAFRYSSTCLHERPWLRPVRFATVIITGSMSVALTAVYPVFPTRTWIAILAAGSTLVTECVTSGFPISLQFPKICTDKKVTWVQGICLLLWIGRLGGPCWMLATTMSGTDRSLSTRSPSWDWARLLSSALDTVTAPAVGPFSAGRKWYTGRKTSQKHFERGLAGATSLMGGNAGKMRNKTVEAASRAGSTAPLTGHNISLAGSSSALNTSCDSLESAAPAGPARPASVHTENTGAVLVGGSTTLVSMPSAGALNDGSKQRHDWGGLEPAEFRLIRLYNLSLESLEKIVERHEGGRCELEDGSFEMTVHRDRLEAMKNDLSLGFPGSTIDTTYDPLVGTEREPPHIKQLNFQRRLADLRGTNHPHAAVYAFLAEAAKS